MKSNNNLDRQIECPAVYKHFKNEYSGIPNNYLYATMFISKPLDSYTDRLNGLFASSGVRLMNVNLEDSEIVITLFLDNGQWYHDSRQFSSELVIYKSLYDGKSDPFARSVEIFLSTVDVLKYPDSTQKYRFERVI